MRHFSMTDTVALVARTAANPANGEFTLSQMYRAIPIIGAVTATKAQHPKASIRRALQEIRDLGAIEFLDNDGRYRWVGPLAA